MNNQPNTKKFFTKLLVILVVAGFLLAACEVGSDPSSLLPKLQVGVDASFPPFESLQAGKNEFSGFDIELMRAIAAKAGYQVEFSNVPRDKLLSGIMGCTYDAGISAIAISEALKPQIQFSDPYLTLGLVVVVQTGNITIRGPEDLAGVLVGVEKSSVAEVEVARIKGVQRISYSTVSQSFQDLVDGNVEAVVASRPRALSYINIPANHLKIVGSDLAQESYGIAICKTNTELVKKIDAALAAVKSDGTLERLEKKYIKK